MSEVSYLDSTAAPSLGSSPLPLFLSPSTLFLSHSLTWCFRNTLSFCSSGKSISVLPKITGNMKSPCVPEKLQYFRTLSPKTEHPCHCRRATAFRSSRSEGSSHCVLPAWGCAHSYRFLCFLCLPPLSPGHPSPQLSRQWPWEALLQFLTLPVHSCLLAGGLICLQAAKFSPHRSKSNPQIGLQLPFVFWRERF